MPAKAENIFWARALGLWLFTVLAASFSGDFLFPEDFSSRAALLLAAIVWPFFLLVLSGQFLRFRFHGLAMPLALTGFFLCAFASCAVSVQPWLSIAYVGLTLVAALVVLHLNAILSSEDYATGFRWYSGLAAALMLGFLSYFHEPGVRFGLTAGISPNAIALISISIALCGMSFKGLVVRAVILAIVGAVIYATGSRTSAVATVAGISLFFLLDKRQSAGRRYAIISLLAGAGTILAFAHSQEMWAAINSFLLLDDPYRGIGTGLSGRTVAWGEAWRLFLQSPLVGVGFRAHEPLMRYATSSHNGYIALLAEVGIFGFLFALAILVIGGIRLVSYYQKAEREATPGLLLSIFIAYLLLAGAERYFFNAGNPTSLLFMLTVMQALPPRRHHGIVPGASSRVAK